MSTRRTPRIVPSEPPPDGAAWVPLANGRGAALVDVADYPLVEPYAWCSRGGYATARVHTPVRRDIHMHRLILGLADDDPRDGEHRNRNPSDNRRGNLRVATRKQNQINHAVRSNNTSGYKGVSFDKGRWTVTMRVNGRSQYFGRFDDPALAAKVYDKAAREHYGEFAFLNFPDEIDAPLPDSVAAVVRRK